MRSGYALARRAARALEGLGTPTEMAAAFDAMGFKGVRRNTAECPCGACLREHFGDERLRVSAWDDDGGLIYVNTEGRIELDGRAKMGTNTREFVRKFDEGAFPEIALSDET